MIVEAIFTFVARFVIGVAIGVVLFSLVGCEDRYRYVCQNPDNFYRPECQKPKCLFTQMCPEYLVAPILEKQVNAPQQPADPAPNR
jgi:hypothetical protein